MEDFCHRCQVPKERECEWCRYLRDLQTRMAAGDPSADVDAQDLVEGLAKKLTAWM